MDSQKLLSLTRKCIDLYQLIDDGDHIAVGVSAGKDSLSLLITLDRLRKFYPHKFDLSAITVDLGLGNFNRKGNIGSLFCGKTFFFGKRFYSSKQYHNRPLWL